MIKLDNSYTRRIKRILQGDKEIGIWKKTRKGYEAKLSNGLTIESLTKKSLIELIENNLNFDRKKYTKETLMKHN